MKFNGFDRPAVSLRLLTSLLSVGLLLGACGRAPPATEAATDAATEAGEVLVTGSPVRPHMGHAPLQSLGAVAGQREAGATELSAQSARLGPATVPGTRRLSAQALNWGTATAQVELRVLVLTTGAGDFGLESARALLRQSGIPFTEVDTTATTLTQAMLQGAGGAGRYSGVILTSSALVTETSPGVYESAMTWDEWTTLFSYEQAFKVRQLALYGYPQASPEDYGLRAVPGQETSSVDATVTPEGQSVFRDLTTLPVPVRYAYTYPSALEAVPGVTTTPLLKDAAGNILAVTSTSPDGRERLLLTAAQNPYLLHTQLLGYGLIQWLTRGVHLGEYRRFLQVDVDDWFYAADVYDPVIQDDIPGAYLITPQDVRSLVAQMAAVRQEYPLAGSFRIANAFNGSPADASGPNTCTPSAAASGPSQLGSVTKCVAASFDWVNHTYEHDLMDTMPYATVRSELNKDYKLGALFGLPVSKKALVTPEHSGLGWYAPLPGGPKVDFGLAAGNPLLLSGAYSVGVRYIATNRSVPSQWNPACPNCGLYSPLNPAVLLVPRWPNNVAYDTTTPAEATLRYNLVYGPGGTAPYWDHPLTYAEFQTKEADMGLMHVLNGTAWPTYMHVGNLREYAPGRSLATDWVRSVLAQYAGYSTLPLNTLKWDDLGLYVRDRTAHETDKAAVQAVWNRATNRVTLVSPSATVIASKVFLTGRANLLGTTFAYGGRNITKLNVTAATSTVPVLPR